MKNIEIYLVRHAETVYNVDNGLIGGRSDHLGITLNGEEQARRLGEYFEKNNLVFDNVFCSSQKRARESLDKTMEVTAFKSIVYCDEIIEQSQGEWEGKLRSEIYTDKQLSEINFTGITFKPPGGESLREVRTRMSDWMYTILDELEGNKKVQSRY
jgi:broad specificity phosphatase PhoE